MIVEILGRVEQHKLCVVTYLNRKCVQGFGLSPMEGRTLAFGESIFGRSVGGPQHTWHL